MSAVTALTKTFTAAPVLAAAAYAAVLSALLLSAGFAISDLLGRRAEVSSAASMLEQLEGRKPPASRGQAASAGEPSGSPFLEGATVTVAGAALIQRVVGAVTKQGGSVLSTQVELQGTQSKAGFISILASCEVEQTALQQLLYDIEAGMPFLFIDQLAVQASDKMSGSGSGRLRVVLAVSGQWKGTP
jgi:general secretion pathway protein M